MYNSTSLTGKRIFHLKDTFNLFPVPKFSILTSIQPSKNMPRSPLLAVVLWKPRFLWGISILERERYKCLRAQKHKQIAPQSPLKDGGAEFPGFQPLPQ
jgi:hypothetical protein